MDRYSMNQQVDEKNFKFKKQNILPPIDNKGNISDPRHYLSNQSKTQREKTNYSWMYNDNSSINNTQYLSIANSNFQPKSLSSISSSNLQSPKMFMTKLNKSFMNSLGSTKSASFLNFQNPKTEDEILDEKKETKFITKLNDSFEIIKEDRDQKDPVGEDAEIEYYSHYRKLQKINQQNKFFPDLKDSIFTSMLKQSENAKIAPRQLGIIKKDGNEDILALNNRKIGNSYATMLSEGIKKAPNINKFHLKNNRISSQGGSVLMKQISKQAKTIDLSQNKIGKEGCEFLNFSLKNKICKIQHLNLEANYLQDEAASLILESCQVNRTLIYLNLSKNLLSDKISESLSIVLNEHPSLEQLYLQWNNITGVGGSNIFKVLAENKNTSLKVLDISNNTLGQGATSCAEELAEFFHNNEEMVHLDLGFNHFNIEQSRIISKALESNKTIYGIHFAGNVGYIDSRGFLVIDAEEEDLEIDCNLTKRKINDCDIVVRKLFRHHRDVDLKDCCWICQGWEEKTFTWTESKSGEGETDPLFIHFNFENFRPCYHGRQLGSKLDYTRMVPPGEMIYFYTMGTGDGQTHAQDHPSQKNSYPQFFHDIKLPDGEYKDVELQRFNVQKIPKRDNLMMQYSPTNTIKPRTRDPVYIPDKKKKTRKRWTFPISLMYKWKPDTDEVINNCFEFDWNHSRVHKVIKNEEQLEQTKQFFKERYRFLRNSYKHYACLNPVVDVWCIQTAGFFEIINHIGIIDNKLVKDADMNIKWTSVISSGEKGNPRNPVQAANRHQFMEIWVRVAEEKYIFKYKSTQSHFEAVKMIWEEHLESLFTTFNPQIWREERYWNEDCDYCLKHYKKIVDQVYKLFSKKKVKPGQAPFMCLDELLQITNQCNLQQEESFGSGVYLMAFNQSMMTQIDEINNDRIFQMNITEYYEAISRIAEEACLPPVCGEFGIFPEDEEWTLEKRKAQPLAYKIEALVLRMYDCCLDSQFKLNHPRPDKSYFWKDPDESDFDYVD